jgi:iron(III) transport system substrate-binding protein
MSNLKAWAGNFLLILSIGSLIVACGKEEERKLTNQEIYLYQGPDREQKLVAKAQQEGAVMIYSSLVPEDLEPMSEAFQKKYGIKVASWRALPEKTAQRAIIEAKAGRHEFDVLGTNETALEGAYREKILERFHSPAFKDIPPEFFPTHKYYVPDRVSLFVVGYNTKLVKPEQVPNSYEDLLNPKWKGKFAIEAGDIDWFIAVAKSMGEEQGIRYFRKLAAMHPVIRVNHTLLAEVIGSGEIPLAINVYNQSVERLKKKDIPVEWKPLQPAFGRANGMGLAKDAPHPHAGLLWVDFVLSKEGQEIIKGRNRIPINSTVESPLSNFKYQLVDSELTAAEREKWTNLWADIFPSSKAAQKAAEK